MGKTVRKVDPRNARWSARALTEGDHTDRFLRFAGRVLRGNDGAIHSDKCQTAQIDSEGGFKLDTWSECPGKKNGREAIRKYRRAGKILVQRQLEEIM
jgi:hypothetical protein